MKSNKVLSLITVVVLFTIIGLIVALKLHWWRYEVYSAYGTFYGGIVGPVATALGFYFLYSAYQNQKSEADFTLLNKLYADLLEDIASMHFRDKRTGIASLFGGESVYQGIDALYNFNLNNTSNSVLNHLNLIIRSFEYLVDRVEKSSYRDDETKGILLKKIYLLYYAKIIWPVFHGIYPLKDEIFVRGWANPRELFFAFEGFTKKTVQYLLTHEVIENPLDRKPQPDLILLNILNTDYKSLPIWADITYTNAQKNFKLPITLRTKIGNGLGWFLPKKVVELIKTNTRYPIFGVS